VWTLVVANRGATDLTGVTLKLLVPEYTYGIGNTGYSPGNTVEWNLGTIRAGQTWTLPASSSVSSQAPGGAVVQTSALVTAANGASAAASATFTVDNSPVLRLALAGDKNPAGPGEAVTYTLSFGNPSTANAPGAMLRVKPAAGVTFESATDGGAVSGEWVQWSLGTVASGESRQRQMTVRVNAGVANGTALVTEAELFDAVANHALRVGHTPPLLSPLSDRIVNEGVSTAFTATAMDRDVPGAQKLTYSLVDAPVGASINASTGEFAWTPTEAQGPGTYPVTVRVTDNGTPPYSDEATFSLDVLEVNAPPIFTQGANQAVLEDAPPQEIVGWTTGIAVGPPGDTGESVAFLIAVDRPELFSTLPAVVAAGTLTYVAQPNASGIATVTVRLRDDGGTENGGGDTSAPQTFTIQVIPASRPVVLRIGSNGGSSIHIAWSTVSRRRYQLLWKQALEDPQWLGFDKPIIGDGDDASATIAASDAVHHFFKVAELR